MKPYFTVKTVKGKKYLQLSDLNGNLIHIGPVRDLETWAVAYKALSNAYQGYVAQELLSFREVLDEAGVDLLKALDASSGIESHQSWEKYLGKLKKSHLSEFLMRKMIGGVDISSPEFLKEVDEEELHWETCKRTSDMTGCSVEAMVMYVRIFDLYGRKNVQPSRSG